MTLIIFDVDGALVCSERKDSPCFVQTYEQLYGKPFPSLDWERFPHVTDTTIFAAVIEQHFSRQSQAAEIAAFQKHYLALLREKRWLDPAHSREAPGARRDGTSFGRRTLLCGRSHRRVAPGGYP